MPGRGKNRESGNIFFMLFGAVALVGVIGAATMTLVRGPLSTVSAVNQRAKADSQLAIASKLATIAAVDSSRTNSGNCDAAAGDTFIEPVPATVATPAPAGGGQLPTSFGAAQVDPWGTPYGYCVWDLGQAVGDPACDDGDAATAPYLTGGNSGAQPVFVVMSAGPNRTFETQCNSWDNVSTPPASQMIVKPGSSDDVLAALTYEEAQNAADGLWSIKTGDPGTITTDKNVEFASGSTATFQGTAQFAPNSRLDLGGVGGAGLFLLPDQTELLNADCTAANSGALRINTASGFNVLEMCDPAVPGFVALGGAGATVSAIDDLSDAASGTADKFLFLGEGAGLNFSSSSGSNNIGIGINAASTLVGGSGNIVIGNDADTNLATTANSIVIGNGVISDGSNTMKIGEFLYGASVYSSSGGMLGIGAAPTVTLDVAGTAEATRFQLDSNTYMDDSSGNLILGAGGSTRVTIESAGNVGIGVADPDVALDVSGDAEISGDAFADQFVSTALGNAGTPNFTFGTATNAGLYYQSSGMGFSIGGLDKMTLTSSGLTVDGFGDFGGYVEGDNFQFTGATNSGLFYASGAGVSVNVGGVAAIFAETSGDVGIGDSTPDVKLDVAGAIRPGDTAVICGASIYGAIRYASGDVLEMCSSMTNDWETIGTSGGGGGGSGGLWTNNTSYITRGTFSVINTGVALPAGLAGAGARAFWYPDKWSFRAGGVSGTQWDDANIGNYSAAFGLDNTASGAYAFSAGRLNTASNAQSIALGYSVTSSGDSSLATGSLTSATGNYSTAMGLKATASGLRSFAFGLGDPVSNPVVSGTGSFGIFMGDQSGVNINTPNLMALMGGKLIIDPDATSAANTVPSGSLTVDVEGGVGAMQYCDQNGANCFTALDISGGSVGAPGNDRELLFNSGGDLWTDVNLVFTSAGRLGIGTSNPQVTLDLAATDALIIPHGTTAERPTAGAAGMLRYNSSTSIDSIEYYDAQTSTWQRIATAADATTAAGSDTQVQFNSGGSFGADADYTWDMANNVLTIANSGTGAVRVGNGAVGAPSLSFTADPNTGLYNIAADTIGFAANGVNYMTVQAPGAANASVIFGGGAAVTLPSGATATRPSAGVNGMIRYNTDNGKFEAYQAGAWQDILTGSAAAAAPDRGIQFNSGGNFAASSNFQYMADGDLLLSGTYTGTASVPASGAGTRMFFDVQASAFRAGSVTGTQWDNANIGNFSVAIGADAKASGLRSVAIGTVGHAAGQDSIVLGGLSSTASGENSIAIGRSVVAGDGTAFSGFGDGSMAIGLSSDAYTITTPSQVQGIQSLGIFMGDQDGLVMSANNTMGLFGGKMVIDPAVPATQLSARAALDMGASTDAILLPIGDGTNRPAAPFNGMLRYNSASGKFEGYQAGAWQDILTGSAAAAAPDRGIQFNSGGNFAASSNFQYMADGDLLLKGTFTGTASVPVSGAGTRMFFDTQKAAFRAGDVDGTQWDNASIGDYSTAFGRGATASGIYAFAQGWDSVATGNNSIAMGNFAYSSADHAVAIGYTAQALAFGAVALGYDSGAEGASSVAIGKYSWTEATAARSIAMGHMSATKGNDAVAIGNNLVASGEGSVALGNYVIAGNDVAGSGLGDGSMALGLIDDAVTITTPSQVTGIQSYGIFMGDQDGLVMSANNTMGLFGGKMVIDPNVPATQLSARAALDMGASTDAILLPIGDGTNRPAAPFNGMLRYNSASGKFEGYQAGAWQDILTSGGGTMAINDLSDAITDYATNMTLALGAAALDSNVNGTWNTAVGINALTANTSGNSSTAVGYNALGTATTGLNNTAVGANALDSSTTASNNTALGTNALTATTIGEENTATGSYAMFSNTTGNYNAAYGASSLEKNISGVDNAAFGHRSLFNNTTGSWNVAMGSRALSSNTSGNANIAIGSPALSNNTTGGWNVAVGDDAMLDNVTGTSNIAIGRSALSSNVAKQESVAIGLYAMGNADDTATAAVTYNTAVGAYALMGSGTAANNTGTHNLAIGHSALLGMTSGSYNLALGDGAGTTITTGSYNILIGSGLEPPTPTTSNYLNIGDFMLGDMGEGVEVRGKALTVPRGTTAQRPATPVNGMLRYNSTSNKFEGYQGGLWTDIITAGAAAAAPDRGIQFNSGGSFAASGAFTYDATGKIYLQNTGTFGGFPARLAGVDYYRHFQIENGDGTSGSFAGVGLRVADFDSGLFSVYSGVGGQGRLALVTENVEALSILLDGSGTRVGIKTDSPAYTLDVNGDIGLPGSGIIYSSARPFLSNRASIGSLIIATDGYGGNPHDSTGAANTIVGHMAGENITTGGSNTLIGNNAGYDLSVSSGNTFIGAGAGLYMDGDWNVALGRSALQYANTGIQDSVYLGVSAGGGNSGNDGGASRVVAIGSSAGQNGDGVNNIFIGYGTGSNASTGTDNILLGYDIELPTAATSNYLNIGGLITGTINAGLMQINGTGALTLPAGTTAQRPGTPVNGMLRYNSSSGKFEGYQGGLWTDIITSGAAASAPDRGIQFNSGGAFTASSNLVYTSAGYLGVGVTNPVRGLEVAADKSYDSVMSLKNLNTSGVSGITLYDDTGAFKGNIGWWGFTYVDIADPLAIVSNDTDIALITGDTGGSPGTIRMVVKAANGYIGMGTSSPASELDIAGTGAVTLARGTTAQRPGTPANGMLRYNSSTSKFEGYQGGAWKDIVTGAVTTTFLSLTDTPASYAGAAGQFVKVNSGANALEFTDTLVNSFSGQPAPTGMVFDDLDDVVITAVASGQFPVYNGTNWVNAANLNWNGTTLAVTGNITFTGTLRDVSDMRLKTDIHPLRDRGSMMGKLEQIGTYSFRMKDDKDGQVEFGVMAQEINKVFPELVAVDESTAEKYMSVNYLGLIAPLLEATKELKAENDTLKSELAAMQTAMADIQGDIKGLKAHTGYGISKASIGLGMMLGMIAAAGLSALFFAAFTLRRQRRQMAGQPTPME